MSAVGLYRCPGCGSHAVDVLLERAGVDFRYRDVEPWAGFALAEQEPIAARVRMRNLKR